MIHVILNPACGGGRGARSERALRTALQAAGLAFDLERTRAPGHARALAVQAWRAGAEIVVAAGGDGTLHEVVNGLADCSQDGAPLGPVLPIPLGNGNDFVHGSGAPRELQEVVRVLHQGHARRVDLGRVTLETGSGRLQRCFVNGLAAGLEAQANLEAAGLPRALGSARYLLGAISALCRYRGARVEVEMGSGEQRSRAAGQRLLVSIANGRRCGGVFFLAPAAAVDDGLLDVVEVDAIARWRALLLLPRALRGRLAPHPAVRIRRAERIELAFADRMPVTADGERLEDATRLAVEVLPGRLSLLG